MKKALVLVLVLAGCSSISPHLPRLDGTDQLHPQFLAGVFHQAAAGASFVSVGSQEDMTEVAVALQENRKFLEEGSPLTAPAEQVLFEQFSTEDWYADMMAGWYAGIALANSLLGPTPTTGDVLGDDWVAVYGAMVDGVIHGATTTE